VFNRQIYIYIYINKLEGKEEGSGEGLFVKERTRKDNNKQQMQDLRE
jgi:hypothetical protein